MTGNGLEESDKTNFNPFDPKNLRIGTKFADGRDVRRVVVSVPVRKPARQEFVRTNPDPEMAIEAAVLEFKQERQTFLVLPEIAQFIPGEAIPKLLLPTLSNHGVLSLWPIRLPDDQGRLDEWNAAALEAAERAKGRWIRLMANMAAGTYDVLEAITQLPQPVWPDFTLQQVLELAFKGRVIDALDHSVLRRLRGEF